MNFSVEFFLKINLCFICMIRYLKMLKIYFSNHIEVYYGTTVKIRYNPEKKLKRHYIM